VAGEVAVFHLLNCFYQSTGKFFNYFVVLIGVALQFLFFKSSNKTDRHLNKQYIALKTKISCRPVIKINFILLNQKNCLTNLHLFIILLKFGLFLNKGELVLQQRTVSSSFRDELFFGNFN